MGLMYLAGERHHSECELRYSEFSKSGELLAVSVEERRYGAKSRCGTGAEYPSLWFQSWRARSWDCLSKNCQGGHVTEAT
jgi:hypothetical protein